MITETKARDIVKDLFKNDKDKAGEPYFNHCLTVAERAKKTAIENGYEDIADMCYIVGLFHDAMEDKGLGFHEMGKLAESFPVAMEVYILSRRKHEKYDDYLERVKESKIATIVKICDLFHNGDVSRFKILEEQNKHRSNCTRYTERAIRLMNFMKLHKVWTHD